MCSDPDADWHPHTTVCWPSAAVEWGHRRLTEKHKDVEVASGAYRETDGVAVFAATTPPEDDPFA